MNSVHTESKIIKTSDGTDMQVFIARPEQKSAPGLMVLQEAFGVNHHMKNVCERFAKEGYLAVCPELFHRTAAAGQSFEYTDFKSAMAHIQAMTQEGLKADLQSTFDLLTADAQSNKNIGAIGYCLGGRSAYLANSFLPLKAAASYYGGRIAPDLLPLAEKQAAPILLVWGGLDQHIGTQHQRMVYDALKAAGKSFVEVEFSSADHGFFCDERASYNKTAAAQAWALTTEFLKTNLKLA